MASLEPNDSSTVRIHPQIILRQVQDEAVLLNLDDGTYYGLNPVGARMLEVLHESADIGAAHRTLLEEYNVDPDQLRRDMEHLIRDMQARNLVIVEP